jgi:histidinol-phosphate aminotransferase
LRLNRYPGPRYADLRAALAQHAGMPQGHALILGNGSDELISLVSLALRLPPAADGQRPVVLAPVPGFVMYAMSAQLQGLDFVGVPLTPDFELDEAAMLAAIALHRPPSPILPTPTTPRPRCGTRTWCSASSTPWARWAASSPWTRPTSLSPAAPGWTACAPSPQRNAHVLLMRTLSKFGLAGVRLGYLMGPAALVGEIDKVRPPYNVSVLNCEAALFALEHADVFAEQARQLRAQRSALLAALRAMPGIEKCWDSEANMVLVRVQDAARTFAGMRERKVLIKNVSTMHPLLANCLRLTVGTADDNAIMLQHSRHPMTSSALVTLRHPPTARPKSAATPPRRASPCA